MGVTLGNTPEQQSHSGSRTDTDYVFRAGEAVQSHLSLQPSLAQRDVLQLFLHARLPFSLFLRLSRFPALQRSV